MNPHHMGLSATAEHLREQPAKQIAKHLNTIITAAFTLEEEIKAMALDYNAHLVTELRIQKIWPSKTPTTDPCEW